MNKYLIIALVIIVLCFGLTKVSNVIDNIMDNRAKSLRCEYYDRDLKLALNGEVHDVFRDKKSHNARKILIHNPKGASGMSLDFDFSGLFEYVQKGDSILKKHGDSKIIVFRNSKEKIFILDYRCDE